MPPAPAEPPNDDEIQIFQDWVTGGTQKGGLCTDPPPDGGTDAGNIGDAGPDAAPGCTSGIMWTMGNTGSPDMHPGAACNACHSATKGPNLTFAGTVYRGGLHDVDDCDGTGTPPPLTVVVTDKNGLTATLTVNDAGNFQLEAPKRDGGARQGFGGGPGRGPVAAPPASALPSTPRSSPARRSTRWSARSPPATAIRATPRPVCTALPAVSSLPDRRSPIVDRRLSDHERRRRPARAPLGIASR